MIILAGQMELSPSQMADFEREVRSMRDRVLREEGCGHYSLLVEDGARGLVNVLEYWENEAALLAHLRQPWITAFFVRFGGHLKSSTVQLYDVAASRPLPEIDTGGD